MISQQKNRAGSVTDFVTQKYVFFTTLVFMRIVNFISSFPAFSGGDSISYRAPSIPQKLPWFIESFTYLPEALIGNAIRPILPVTFFYFLNSDSLRITAMFLFSILAWYHLGLTLFKSFFINSNNYIIWIFFGSFLVIANSPEVLTWNRIIYSESLAISVYALFISLSLKLLFSNKINIAIFLAWLFSAFFVGTTRIDQSFLVIATTSWILFRIRKKAKSQFVLMLTYIILLLSVLGYNFRITKTWEHQVSRPLVTISYFMSQDSYLSSQTVDFVNNHSNVPSCAKILKTYNSGTQLEWSLPFKKTCPEAIRWANSNIVPMYVYLFRHFPLEFSLGFFRTVIAGDRYKPYLSGVTVVPQPIHDIIFPTANSTHVSDLYENRPSVNSFFTYEPLFILILISILCRFYLRRNQNRKSINTFFSINIIGLTLAWFSSALLIPGPDAESYRLAIVPSIFIRLFIILIILNQLSLINSTKNGKT